MKALVELSSRIRSCRECKLRHKARRPVPGVGKPGAEIMLVGQAPGWQEDRDGIPFIGDAGQLLDSQLSLMGIDDYYVTNTCKCYPGKGVGGDALPPAAAMATCEEYLKEEIRLVQPKLIVAIGAVAMRWFGIAGGIKQNAGRVFDTYYGPVIPILHPAGVMRRLSEAPQLATSFHSIITAIRGAYTPPPFGPAILTDPDTFGIDIETQDNKVWCVGVADEIIRYAEKGDWPPSIDSTPVFHNAKYDLSFLDPDGSRFERWHDTILQAHMLGYKPLNLPMLSAIFNGVPLDKSFIKKGLDNNPDDSLTGCSLDAWATYNLDKILRHRLDKWVDLYEKEKKITRVIMDMERGGMPISQERVKISKRAMLKRMGELETTLRGEGIPNPNDREFVSQRFWKGKRKIATTKTGKLSIDRETLEKFATPEQKRWVEALLEWRSVSKFISTYLENWTKQDRLHPSLNQTGTISWRFSCSNPNLQNIPKLKTVSLYQMFVAPEGWTFISADYKQAELVALANMSQDPAFIRDLLSGRDFHDIAVERWGLLERFGDPDYARRFAKCFHPDTEVLTRTGWRKIPELRVGEEIVQAVPGKKGAVRLEWVVPLEVFTTHHPSGQLVHLKNHGIDIRVTHDHRMLAWQTDERRVVFPHEMGKQRYWANAGICDTGSWEPDETLLRLAVATEADGYYSGRRIRFGFYDQRKIAALNAMVPGLVWKLHKNGKLRDVNTCALSLKLSNQIRDLLTPDKQFHWGWTTLSLRLRRIVLDELSTWDGGQYRGWTQSVYTSGNQQSRDVVQAIAAISGIKAQQRAGAVYLKDHSTTRGGNLQVTTEDFTGEVACLSVPSTFVLVRSGGVPVITGQTINFGIIYGITSYGLAPRLGVVEGVAEQYIESFYEAYPRVREWQNEQIEHAREYGYVETFYGRPLWIVGINMERGRLVEHAKKQCMNLPIQGSVAEVVKDAMLRAPQHLRMQVHDELLYLVQENEVEEYKQFLAETLPDLRFDIPYGVDISVGKSWGDIKHQPDTLFTEEEDDIL